MKKALIVGINDYPSPLRGCVKDASDFADLIRTNGDSTINFTTLLETNVLRKSTLLQWVEKLFRGTAETALFYFSGHGFINELGGYLVTPDHRRYDEGISMNDILTLANKSTIANKIIILDCCHSGAMAMPELTAGSIGHINEGITILTASRKDEAAVELNGKGVFTTLLLEGLKGGAADVNGNITPGSIYAYIDQALGPWEQRPVFKTNVSSFTSLRRVSPKITPATLRKIISFFPSADEQHSLSPSYEYTNDPAMAHSYIEPYARKEDIAVFEALQEMYSAGLVEPVGAQHMYWAAMNSKSCRLTPLGAHYWRLVQERRI